MAVVDSITHKIPGDAATTVAGELSAGVTGGEGAAVLITVISTVVEVVTAV